MCRKPMKKPITYEKVKDFERMVARKKGI